MIYGTFASSVAQAPEWVSPVQGAPPGLRAEPCRRPVPIIRATVGTSIYIYIYSEAPTVAPNYRRFGLATSRTGVATGVEPRSDSSADPGRPHADANPAEPWRLLGGLPWGLIPRSEGASLPAPPRRPRGDVLKKEPPKQTPDSGFAS